MWISDAEAAVGLVRDRPLASEDYPPVLASGNPRWVAVLERLGKKHRRQVLIAKARRLLLALEGLAWRLLVNGFGTGVEV